MMSHLIPFTPLEDTSLTSMQSKLTTILKKDCLSQETCKIILDFIFSHTLIEYANSDKKYGKK